MGWLLGLVKLATLRGSLRARAYSFPICSSEDFPAPLVSISRLLPAAQAILRSHPPALCVCVSLSLSLSLSQAISKKDLKSDHASTISPWSKPPAPHAQMLPAIHRGLYHVLLCIPQLRIHPQLPSHLEQKQKSIPQLGPPAQSLFSLISNPMCLPSMSLAFPEYLKPSAWKVLGPGIWGLPPSQPSSLFSNSSSQAIDLQVMVPLSPPPTTLGFLSPSHLSLTPHILHRLIL